MSPVVGIDECNKAGNLWIPYYPFQCSGFKMPVLQFGPMHVTGSQERGMMWQDICAATFDSSTTTFEPFKQ